MTKRLTILLMAMVATFYADIATISADNTNLPTVELLGGNYYVYTAKKGESVFAIARRYGWDDQLLAELNPSAISPLKKGMILYYPTEQSAHKSVAPGMSQRTTAAQTEVTHKVKRGETVYSIAGTYGLSIDKLYSLNPSARHGIKAGETLLIKKGDTADLGIDANRHDAVFYTVKPGDTLYSLSQTYNVSVASIMAENPGVTDRNFQAGSTIKIPKMGTGIRMETEEFEEPNFGGVELRQVEKNETWGSIARANNIDVKTLKDANPTLSKLKAKDYIVIPRIETRVEQREVPYEDPREKTLEGRNEIYEDIHNLAQEEETERSVIRIAIVAENHESNKDAEFLRGFLTGVERVKDSDAKVSLKVIDGTADKSEVVELLDGFNPTIIFATHETNIPSYLGEYAYTKHTPLVNIFDVRNEAYLENPYLVQLLTPPTLFNDNVAHYVHERYDGYKLLMIGTPDKNDQLADALLALWNPELVKRAPIENVKPQAFREEKYLIYSYDVKKDRVEELLERVADVREEHPLADIAMLGRPNLVLFEDQLGEKYKKAAVSYPSRFYIDKESRVFGEFNDVYKDLFDRTPVKSLPMYAVVGYDAASYFIPALVTAGGDINEINPSRGTVQSEFHLVRPNNWSGLINPPVYMVDYSPLGFVTKNVIFYTD